MNDRDHEARHPLMGQAAEDRRQRRTRRRHPSPEGTFADTIGEALRAPSPLFGKVRPDVEGPFPGAPFSGFFRIPIARAPVAAPHFGAGGRVTAPPGDRRCKVTAGAAPARAPIFERRHRHDFLAIFCRALPHETSGFVQQANAIPAITGEESADFVNDVRTVLEATDDRTCRPMEDGGGHGRDSEDTEDDEVRPIARPRHRWGRIARSSFFPQPL